MVVVHAVDPGEGCGYTLAVNGGSCRPVLDITRASTNRVVLDWSTAAVGYSLETTNALPNASLPLWVPVSIAPVIINGRFNVTNNSTSGAAFFRLRKP